MKIFTAYLPFFLLAIVAGCVPAGQTVEQTALDTLDENYRLVYRKIEDASIILAALQPETEVISGSPAILELTLTNTGSKLLNVPEWYQEEANNFLVHFRPLPTNETPAEAIAAEWYMIAPEFTKGNQPERRHFSLAPGNTAICSVPLDFVEYLPADTNMIFIAFAELNLTSLTATSPMFLIIANSSEMENEQ